MWLHLKQSRSLILDIQNYYNLTIRNKKKTTGADGGPHSLVWTCATLYSAHHRHQRIFFGSHVHIKLYFLCKIAEPQDNPFLENSNQGWMKRKQEGFLLYQTLTSTERLQSEEWRMMCLWILSIWYRGCYWYGMLCMSMYFHELTLHTFSSYPLQIFYSGWFPKLQLCCFLEWCFGVKAAALPHNISSPSSLRNQQVSISCKIIETC